MRHEWEDGHATDVAETIIESGRDYEPEVERVLDVSSNYGPEAKRLASFRLPVQVSTDVGKMTVVLDVDETLVHTVTLPKDAPDVELENFPGAFTIKVGETTMLVQKRPFLDEFLREASLRFELVAFTAGSEEYAMPLLDYLDPTGQYFRHRLFRRHCQSKCGKNYIKDLLILNRDLNRAVMVDNNPYSFLFQPSNGIPIATFIDDPNDKALVTLFDFLIALEHEVDVRKCLRGIFAMEAMFESCKESTAIAARNGDSSPERTR